MSTENEKTYNGSGSARVLYYEVEAESYIGDWMQMCLSCNGLWW